MAFRDSRLSGSDTNGSVAEASGSRASTTRNGTRGSARSGLNDGVDAVSVAGRTRYRFVQSAQPVELTPEMRELEKAGLLARKQAELQKVVDRHDDLVREKFHMENFTMMLLYNPTEAKTDQTAVFREYKSRHDLIDNTAPVAGPSRQTRNRRNEHRQIVSSTAIPAPQPTIHKKRKANTQPSTTLEILETLTSASPHKGKGKEKETTREPEPFVSPLLEIIVRPRPPLESISAPMPSIDESTVGERRRPQRKRKASWTTPTITEESPMAEVVLDEPRPPSEAHKKSRLRRGTISGKLPFGASEAIQNLGEPPTIQHKHGINGFTPCSPVAPAESISVALTRRSGRLKDPPPTASIPVPQTPKIKIRFPIENKTPLSEPPPLSTIDPNPTPPSPSKVKRIKLIVRRPPPTISHPKQIPPEPKFNSSLSSFLSSYINIDEEDTTAGTLAKEAKAEAVIREQINQFRKDERFIPGTEVIFGTVPPTDEYTSPNRSTKDIWDHIVETITARDKAKKKPVGRQIASQIASKVQAYFDGQEAKKNKTREQEERRLRNLAKSTMKLVVAEWKKAVYHIREKERLAQEAEELRLGHAHLDAILNQSGHLLETQQVDLSRGEIYGSRSRSGSIPDDIDDEDEDDDGVSSSEEENEGENDVDGDDEEDDEEKEKNDDGQDNDAAEESGTHSLLADHSAPQSEVDVEGPSLFSSQSATPSRISRTPVSDYQDDYDVSTRALLNFSQEDNNLDGDADMKSVTSFDEALAELANPPPESSPQRPLTSCSPQDAKQFQEIEPFPLERLRSPEIQANVNSLHNDLSGSSDHRDLETEDNIIVPTADDDDDFGSEPGELHNRVVDMPLSEDTILGEEWVGTKLFGGPRQEGEEKEQKEKEEEEGGEGQAADAESRKGKEREDEEEGDVEQGGVERHDLKSTRNEQEEESKEGQEETSMEKERGTREKEKDRQAIESRIPDYLKPYAVAPVEWDPDEPVAPPLLLRGVLRPYQQSGLEWLASLHTNKLNGILADEMGLGKTIQTIALLAYLACNRGIWGPHLIVVPTSVLLNWEMEFKKFLPGFRVLSYHGTTKRRKELRQGWNDKHSFNVCITSYTLASRDAHIFKRKAWYYMILDEAHMIKNFKSQRWNLLLMFRSYRRLLLTGTPLQNNLTELWALLQFLMSGANFANLKEFGEWFSNPLEKAIEMGSIQDDETMQRVTKLHTVLRPYLLRRLKRDVEKELPSKFEHLTLCPLSKRQRFLYDEFMSRAQTKDALESGVYQKIANILMQLRKVCNHPDLFEVRPIVTSFVTRSAVADFEIKELLVRRRFLKEEEDVNLDVIGLRFVAHQNQPLMTSIAIRSLDASKHLPCYMESPGTPPPKDTRTIAGFRKYSAYLKRANDIARWSHIGYLNALRCSRIPIYGQEMLSVVQSMTKPIIPFSHLSSPQTFLDNVDRVNQAVKSYSERSDEMGSLIDHFAFVTPPVVSLDLPRITLAGSQNAILAQPLDFDQVLHRASVKLQIAFPDPSLLQYDCGKLQRLTTLLREKKAGGHRILIFTQMTRILDILEIFLNFHGYLYLRLDGATKIEDRQYITERFNADPRIFCFIASSRSGGVGINLTGADTVIFYDSDFNPQMDRQCEDRAHRIGQIRDVHIYRFVSQYTVEEAMLLKADQKRTLDDLVIQKGEFDWRSLFNDEGALTKALGDFEDAEDRNAAVIAAREEISLVGADEDDFGGGDAVDTSNGGPRASPADGTTTAPGIGAGEDLGYADLGRRGGGEKTGTEEAGAEDEEGGSVVDYMLAFIERDYDDFREWRL